MASTKPKRQFRGTSKPRTFYDRQLRPQGNTQSLSVGKILPDNWRRVRVEVLKATPKYVTVKITKLLDVEMLAQATAPNQVSEPDA